MSNIKEVVLGVKCHAATSNNEVLKTTIKGMCRGLENNLLSTLSIKDFDPQDGKLQIQFIGVIEGDIISNKEKNVVSPVVEEELTENELLSEVPTTKKRG